MDNMKELKELGKNSEVTFQEPLVAEVDEASRVAKELSQFENPPWTLDGDYLWTTFKTLLRETVLLAVSVVGGTLLGCAGYFYLNLLGNPLYQASFGLGNSYMLVFFQAVLMSSLDRVGIQLSVAYGEKNYKLCKKYFAQGAISVAILFIFFTTPLFIYSYDLLAWLGIAEENSYVIGQMCKHLFPPIIIQTVGEILKTMCMSQGHEKIFGMVSVISAPLAMILGYFLVVKCEMYINGWIWAKGIYETVGLIAAIWVYTQRVHPETRGWPEESWVDGFLKFFWETLKFTFSTYSEYMGFEVTSYFVAITHDNNAIAAYSAIISVAALVFTTGMAFAFIARTRINLLIGMGRGQTAKNFWIFFEVSCVVFSSFYMILCFFIPDYIAKIFADSSPEMKNIFVQLLFIYGIVMPSEVSCLTSVVAVKSVGKIVQIIGFVFVYYVCMNFIISYNFHNWGYGAPALFTGLCLSIFFFNVTMITIALLTDWTKIKPHQHKHAEDLDVLSAHEEDMPLREGSVRKL